MKIFNYTKPKGIIFKDLQPGDCFTYHDSLMVMMKTSGEEINNAISLTNGHLHTHKGSTPVIPLPSAYITFPKEEETETPKEWYNYTFKEIKANYCRKDFGCLNCPIGSACSGYMRIDDLMDEVEVDDDILDE
jgi:aldehyde:ferredoxin oxidoreductase